MLFITSYTMNSRIGKMINLHKLEPMVSTIIIGGFFALAIAPTLFVIWFVQLSPDSVLFYYVSKRHVISITLAFVAYYIITVLIMDNSHLQVPKASVLKMHPGMWNIAHRHLSAHFDYFPVTCVPWSDDAKLDPTRQYIFGVHPHGIHCWPLNVLAFEGGPFDKVFPGLTGKNLTGLCATVLFKLPIVRELFLMMRYIDARREVANACLLEGQSIYVCTGGEQESMETKVGEDIVVLSKRKGFVRLALSHGADLVPVYGAGVSDLYTTYSFMDRIRKKVQKSFGVALPIFHGRWGTPLPYKVPLRILIGEPIATPTPLVKGAQVDPKLVDEYHLKYITALKAMHAKHVKDRTLKVM